MLVTCTGKKSPERLQHLFFFEEYQSLWHDAFCAIFGSLSCVELLLTGHGTKYFGNFYRYVQNLDLSCQLK